MCKKKDQENLRQVEEKRKRDNAKINLRETPMRFATSAKGLAC